jgi:hypothetical protein
LIDRFEQLNSLVLSGEENTQKLAKDFNAMYKVLLSRDNDYKKALEVAGSFQKYALKRIQNYVLIN